jgi:hypothetical protein
MRGVARQPVLLSRWGVPLPMPMSACPTETSRDSSDFHPRRPPTDPRDFTPDLQATRAGDAGDPEPGCAGFCACRLVLYWRTRSLRQNRCAYRPRACRGPVFSTPWRFRSPALSPALPADASATTPPQREKYEYGNTRRESRIRHAVVRMTLPRLAIAHLHAVEIWSTMQITRRLPSVHGVTETELWRRSVSVCTQAPTFKTGGGPALGTGGGPALAYVHLGLPLEPGAAHVGYLRTAAADTRTQAVAQRNKTVPFGLIALATTPSRWHT